MSDDAYQPISADKVREIAKLARIAVVPEEIESLREEINAVLGFAKQLAEVDVSGVEPMTSVNAPMKMREDAVTDGKDREAVLKNAPETDGKFFLVPRVLDE